MLVLVDSYKLFKKKKKVEAFLQLSNRKVLINSYQLVSYSLDSNWKW